MKKIFIILIFISGVLTSYSQWEMIYSIENFSFTDIEFINRDTGFISGKVVIPTDSIRGLIGKTSDGGNNWDISYYNEEIYKIYYLNEQAIFAGANYSTIYKSSDLGLTWDTVLYKPPCINPFFGFASFYFLNDSSGLISNYGTPTVFKTLDGGNSWSEVSSFNFYGFPRGILSFISDSIGYLGKIYRTNDFGNTWFIDSTIWPPPLYQFTSFPQDKSFYNPITTNHWVVLGHFNDPTYACNYIGSILTTFDSGNNWIIKKYPSFADFQTIEIIDQNVIFIGGSPNCYQDSVPIQFYPYSICKTLDGGIKWYYQAIIPDTIDYFVQAIDMVTQDSGFAVANFDLNITGTRYSAILKTENSGGPFIGELDALQVLEFNSANNHTNFLSIFPNPASTLLTLEFPEPGGGEKTLEVYNLGGQKVLSRQVENTSQYQLDVSALPQGNYLLKVVGKNEVFVRKFVIIR